MFGCLFKSCHLMSTLSFERKLVSKQLKGGFFGWGIGGPYTPPKTNMEPKYYPFGKGETSTNIYKPPISAFHVSFRGCTIQGWYGMKSLFPRFESVWLCLSNLSVQKQTLLQPRQKPRRVISLPSRSAPFWFQQLLQVNFVKGVECSFTHNTNNLRTCLICPLTTVTRKWPGPVLAVLA